MIDYSVYMQPNPMDETAAPKAYAKAQMHQLMTFEKFIDHIATHNGVFTRGTVRGVVVDMIFFIKINNHNNFYQKKIIIIK